MAVSLRFTGVRPLCRLFCRLSDFLSIQFVGFLLEGKGRHEPNDADEQHRIEPCMEDLAGKEGGQPLDHACHVGVFEGGIARLVNTQLFQFITAVQPFFLKIGIVNTALFFRIDELL